MTEPTLHPMLLSVCSYCRKGAGGECHTPGCAFWMNRAPDVPLAAVLSRDEIVVASARSMDPMYGRRLAIGGTRDALSYAAAEAVLIAAGVIEADAREAMLTEGRGDA